MAKQKKAPRPKAETPKGFRDYFGHEVTTRSEMLRKIAGVYHRYGFDALESSAVETVEALGKFLPDVDRPNEGVFAWQEDEGDWLALRYDLTAPLARVYAQHRNDLPTPYRRYAMGPVWRNEKPGPGRFRQFYQCDADTVGTASMAADAEICAMLADTLEEVGIPRGDYIIRVNNRKVLNGVLETMGLSDDTQRDAVLRTIDKFDKVGETGVRELLGKGRLDASGAYIDGVGLSEAQMQPVLGFINYFEVVQNELSLEASQARDEGNADRGSQLDNARHSVMFEFKDDPVASDPEALAIWNNRVFNHLKRLIGSSSIGFSGVEELREIFELLGAQGYGADRVRVDPSVVRGLGYYTGPVYEAELTFEIFDEKGRKRQFGSVAGGGRYDDLVKRFTGQAVPATGVSIGVDRLLAALREKGRIEAREEGPVVVTVMDRDRMADYQAMVGELRQAGIRAEVYLGNPKNFGNQLKYADRRHSPVAVIEGGDEKAKGVVQIKDLILGAKIAETATLEEWKDRPSQFEVPRDQLVAKVRDILDAHKP
ncbi:histidine--tRNA ligase [Lutimaribacter sp. EGI FJ00015]|uniref:Histidine--tRNA ligase n=1 Tax=Lutimaribacter degradans TaxID=2945989 RepID=A0ACC5ZZ69_9RHOB|nr:histidine--tRNA ligase [Lutimaribacter sp. EGI FJ00013]MCM2563647.1 histidine--tRNA ligase [Lutimaribacter sp. EGI FJ00013]MCO0614817.1 histidine--tRNA ligase [Lutimaribacter sp. EGI FJ00015]MCO0637499.1 histidine--tRNA ligase [Lutimaribacter sp. EGI FJ00014]